MSNEQSCLVRDGPLMTIQSQTGSSAKLKQKPGRSLPHGEFDLDNPNQQILATNDIYEEYGASKSPNCESYLTMEDSGGNKVMVRSRDPVLSEEQREKCRQWAEEGIEYCNFTGNDMMKLEEEAGRQRIQRLFFDMSSLEKGCDEFFNQMSTSNRSSKEPEFDALSPPPMIEYDSEELERLLCDKEDIKSQ